MQLARDFVALARAVVTGILDGLFQREQHAHVFARISRVHEYGPLFQQVALLLQHQVERGIQQGMAGGNQDSRRFARDGDALLLKDNALVAAQDDRPAIVTGQTLANGGGYVGDLISLPPRRRKASRKKEAM